MGSFFSKFADHQRNTKMRPPFFLTCILILISTFTTFAQPPQKSTNQTKVLQNGFLAESNSDISSSNVSVNDTSSNVVTMDIGDVVSDYGQNIVVVPITITEDFSIISYQFALEWDSTLNFLDFEDLIGGGQPSENQVGSTIYLGKLIFSLQPVSLSAGDTLFLIKFEVPDNVLSGTNYSITLRPDVPTEVGIFSGGSFIGYKLQMNPGSITLPAPPPERFTYQAVIRDNDNSIIRNTTIGLRLSVLKDSSTSTTPVYSETHNLTTNSSGLITTEIGGGTVQNGKFSSIMWGDGIYFIKTEIDVNGGTDYGISGVTRVLSVPYALYSKRARYSDSSGAALNAQYSSNSAYSDSARVTGYSQTSGTSSYSDSSRVTNTATYSDSSRITNYSDSARVARLLPRMTTTQRDSIQNPEQGLQIFNLTTSCLELNMGSSTNPEWFQLGCLGTVDSLLCDSAIVSQGLTVKTPSDGRTVTIPYTNGNSYDYPQKVFQSQGVSGLTLSLLKGRVNSDDGDISMEFSGTPQDTGTALFLLDVVTKSCSLEVYVDVARVDSLLCDESTISNQIVEGDSVNSVSIQLSYRGGNGGYLLRDTIESTQVIGMTAIIDSGYLGIGDDSIQINLGGVPLGNGVGYFPIAIGSKTCSLGIYVIDSSTAYYPDGYVHCDPLNPTEVVEVLNPITNKIWMDRNLGASRVATSYNDEEAYGDLFQWGRFADGHQCRDSDTTNTTATTTVPNEGNLWDGKFIVPRDFLDENWLTPIEDNLWQETSGVNNPCPSGYRLPTNTELEAERLSWSQNNSTGAFNSPLKLPVSGYRFDSEIVLAGSNSACWSSSVSDSRAGYMSFYSYAANGWQERWSGFTVRCIKD